MASTMWNASTAARSSKPKTSNPLQLRKRTNSARADSLHAAVHVLAMSHLDHEHEENFVPDVIDNAVVLAGTDVDAKELFLGLHQFEAVGARILFEAENVPIHLLADVGIELADVPLGGRSDFNTTGQL